MRIGVDGRALRHPHAGIGVYTREILRRLGRDHELFVYLDCALPDAALRDGIRGTFRAGPQQRRRLHGLRTAHCGFARWARQDRVDVFFAPRHHLPLALSGVPSVVTIHDLVWRVAPETMHPATRFFDATLMPIALRRATRIIAVSADTAQRIRRYCGRVADVVPEAAKDAPQAEPFACARPYFLFVGTREPRKNLPGMMEGFRRARAAGIDHDFVLVGGRGWQQAALDRALAAPDIAPRIRNLGTVSAAQLAGLYQGCTALVLASFYEGFGLPLIEAMRAGRPLIVSRRGALAEVAGDAALLVEPDSPASIARALLRLARDTAAAERLAANARARAARFSWQRAARETAAVLAAAAEAPRIR